jgi:hypothetical protein
MTFEEAMRALLSDANLDAARGGVIIEHDDDQFTYRLHGQPEDESGKFFLDLNPSSTPEVMWRVFPLGKKAQEAYRAFTLNPENGELTLVKR